MLDDTREETVSQASNGEPGTKEAEALVTALNHSAERVQTLWFSFLTFMLYLAVATGTTTHRMLFLKDPLNLPVLNIPLPLLGFYILTPIVFVVLHFYMLLNLVLLARTARTFEDALARALPEDGEARENFRMRIENTLFVQLLVGGRLEREGINAKLLSLMALISLALAPVALLLMFEVKFLPYHSEGITWLHRGLLALDLALVWTLWPGYRRQAGERLWPERSWWLVPAGALSAVALAYAVLVATFPDEKIYLATNGLHGESYRVPVSGELSWRDRRVWYGWIAPVSSLDLRGESLIDYAKLENITKKNKSETGENKWEPILLLAERDMTEANMSDTDIRQVEFSDAIFNRANLNGAWAKNAHLDKAKLQGASLKGAQVQSASLNGANLQGAFLEKAQLQEALFRCAHYDDKGNGYDCAQLQNAKLNGAQLRGASLKGAQLQRASLDSADLQGASLESADLQGASLNYAQLKGASLQVAQLQSASLNYAQLKGASIDRADLRGASLDSADLRGASLREAELQGASFVSVCIWRADARDADWKDTMVVLPKAGCDWKATGFADLKQLIAEKVPEGENKRAAMERIERSLDPTKALEGEDKMAKIWAAREREAPTPEAYEKNLARQWQELGCAEEGAPYVLHGLIDQLRRLDSPFRDQSDAAKTLAAAFLDDVPCPGVHGLPEADIAKLREIAAPAAPPAPKP